MVGDEVRRAGPGARVEVGVPHGTNRETLAWLESWFSGLRGEGVDLDIRCEAAPRRAWTARSRATLDSRRTFQAIRNT
jgi:hypothetical protein